MYIQGIHKVTILVKAVFLKINCMLLHRYILLIGKLCIKNHCYIFNQLLRFACKPI